MIKIYVSRWNCVRNYSEPILYELASKNESLKTIVETNKGCFSEPPGQLHHSSGQFAGSTEKMLPFTSYKLALEVSKDNRKSNFTQNFIVGASDPPVLSLRYLVFFIYPKKIDFICLLWTCLALFIFFQIPEKTYVEFLWFLFVRWFEPQGFVKMLHSAISFCWTSVGPNWCQKSFSIWNQHNFCELNFFLFCCFSSQF